MKALLSRIIDAAIGRHRSPAVDAAVASRPVFQASSHSQRDFDIFISYRRDKGAEVARVLAEKLKSRGYRVFLDVDGLGSGEWNRQLSERIAECPDFIAVVTDGFFVRCDNSDDVVRQEIAHALARNSTVIPLLVGHATIPSDLPADISRISAHNGVTYLHEYAEQAVDKVCGFLRSTPLLGPERLGTGEAQPRIIVLIVLLVIGIWRGAFVGDDLTFGWQVDAVSGLVMGLMALPLLVLPMMVALTAYGNLRKIRRDALYAGPWALLWAFLVPIMFAATSLFVSVVQRLLWGRSFLLGGILGGLLAIPMSRVVIETNVWDLLAKSLGLKNR